MDFKSKSDGRNVVLRGISNGGPLVVSFKCMERLFGHDQVDWAAECIVMFIVTKEEKHSYHQTFRIYYPSEEISLVAYLSVGLLIEALSMLLSWRRGLIPLSLHHMGTRRDIRVKLRRKLMSF